MPTIRSESFVDVGFVRGSRSSWLPEMRGVASGDAGFIERAPLAAEL